MSLPPNPRGGISRPLGSATIAVTLAVVSVLSVRGQDPPRISGEIRGQGGRPVRIALPDPAGPPSGGTREFIETVRADLEFSGWFEIIDPSLYRLVPAGKVADRLEAWQSIGAEALVESRVQIGNTRLDVDGRLFETSRPEPLFNKIYGGEKGLLRLLAHRLADDIVHQFTGRRGSAATRIAFVSKYGEGKEIYLMDYDGQRIRRLTTSGTLNLSPAWSPDGDELAFVSWRGKQPGVYVMSSEGKLRNLPTVGGELSSAPEWSPDGHLLAYTSNIGGNTEIYILDRRTGQNRRLTHHPSIDTAPAFSPNGREIAFTSDRSGNPQLFVMDTDGLNVRRLTWEGNYNDSAAWSPRGDQIAFASRVEGRFEIVLLDLPTGGRTPLTRASGNNENPRWSPDGRHLVFASNRRGTYDIYTMRADGSDVRQRTTGGNCSTPDWSR